MDMINDMDMLHSQQLYNPTNDLIMAKQHESLELLEKFNALSVKDKKQRKDLMKQMFKSVGEGSHVEPPLRANWGGRFLSLGKNVYINFNLSLVDDTYISIGDGTLIGPNVTIATAIHPEDPKIRKTGYQYNLPVTIGKNVWIGSGAIILPGVKIGDDSIIGAGSVVTKDIPNGVVAVGNPCRVLRQVRKDEADSK